MVDRYFWMVAPRQIDLGWSLPRMHSIQSELSVSKAQRVVSNKCIGLVDTTMEVKTFGDNYWFRLKMVLDKSYLSFGSVGARRWYSSQ